MDAQEYNTSPGEGRRKTQYKTVSGFGAAHTISGDRLGYLSTSATPMKTKQLKLYLSFYNLLGNELKVPLRHLHLTFKQGTEVASKLQYIPHLTDHLSIST